MLTYVSIADVIHHSSQTSDDEFVAPSMTHMGIKTFQKSLPKEQ